MHNQIYKQKMSNKQTKTSKQHRNLNTAASLCSLIMYIPELRIACNFWNWFGFQYRWFTRPSLCKSKAKSERFMRYARVNSLSVQNAFNAFQSVRRRERFLFLFLLWSLTCPPSITCCAACETQAWRLFVRLCITVCITASSFINSYCFGIVLCLFCVHTATFWYDENCQA